VTEIDTPLPSAPVQGLPQSGQLPSGYDAISSGVSTAFSHEEQWIISLLVAGDHLSTVLHGYDCIVHVVTTVTVPVKAVAETPAGAVVSNSVIYSTFPWR
jgi:hypothetical protein